MFIFCISQSLFRRQPTTISVAAPPYQEDILSDVIAGETSTVVTAAGSVNTTDATGVPPALRTSHSSNNVLNPNLSGSFKDDDEEDDAPLQCIYEPAAPTVISNSTNPSQSQQIAEGGDNNQQPIVTADSDSVFIQTPTQGGIAVAALPRDINETHIPPATTNTARFW